jgi:hypothetical protein
LRRKGKKAVGGVGTGDSRWRSQVERSQMGHGGRMDCLLTPRTAQVGRHP